MFSIFRQILLIFLLTFAPIAMMSQVKISIEIENYDDSLYYLLKYKSDKSLIVIDSSTVVKGNKIFKQSNNYPEGIYVLADSKQNPIFELLLGKDQKFTINVGDLTRNETYIIKGERGSGCICLNGAAARKVQVGDIVIIMSYALMDFEEAKSFKPSVIFPDSTTNKLV